MKGAVFLYIAPLFENNLKFKYMKWSQMRLKMANKGDVVSTMYGECKIMLVEYNSNLNWWEYVIATDFGNKRITNDGIIKELRIKKLSTKN